MASLSLSAAVTRARSASRSANGPTPANRSAIVCRPRRNAPATSAASAASPAAVACRKPPGGSATRARPMVTVGAARCATISPWRVSRASRCLLGDARQRRGRAPPSAVPSRARRRRGRSRSRSPGCRAACACARCVSAIAQAAGDRAVERRRQDRAAVDGDDAMRARRGEADLEHVALAAARMQHRAAAAFAMGVDQLVDRMRRAQPATAPRPPGRASIRDSAPPSSAAARSRRRCRNADRSARCAPGSRPRS